MILAIKIVLTIFLAICIAICAWLIISEIITYRNWARLIASLFFMILGAIDIAILWFV